MPKYLSSTRFGNPKISTTDRVLKLLIKLRMYKFALANRKPNVPIFGLLSELPMVAQLKEIAQPGHLARGLLKGSCLRSFVSETNGSVQTKTNI